MKAFVTILDNEFEVEWDFTITASGSSGCAPSLNYPGDPPDPCEFDIEIVELRFPKQDADVHLDIPNWLNDMLTTHLLERDDINQVVQEADSERGYEDPDDAYDRVGPRT